MIIFLKNKHTLQVEDFYFKCSIGKNGISKNKIEGDKKTPKGTYKIGPLYYRKDRVKNIKTELKYISINKKMGWCDDARDFKNYNKMIYTNTNSSHEKLYRKDHKYDLLIPIKYNYSNPTPGRGSCIFIHLTKNFGPTAGCIALSKKDFLIMLKIINKNTKIKI
tara:strand:- start:1224 stop:1715 length:492 start_codon:yes stop_codon:yes gene_type:complete